MALKNVQELELLEASPLANLPRVRQLAEEEFPRAVFRNGFALRQVLFDAASSYVATSARCQTTRGSCPSFKPTFKA